MWDLEKVIEVLNQLYITTEPSYTIGGVSAIDIHTSDDNLRKKLLTNLKKIRTLEVEGDLDDVVWHVVKGNNIVVVLFFQ
jgi:hypothetical protein